MRFMPGLIPLACLATACSSDTAPDARTASPRAHLPLTSTPVAPATALTETLRAIATEYASWHRVDEWSHWAPELCRMQPSVGRISTSDDRDTHGGKLYYLYAKDRAGYIASHDADQPIGQVIVKESWTPVELGASDTVDALSKTIDGHTIAARDGKRWKPGEKHGLFVMIKCPADTPDTDAGWIYATTSADGRVVHDSGRIATCMGCHDDGTRDRMFGLKE